MKVKPLLDDWEIPHIESIQVAEQRAFVEMRVPGMVGSLYQDLNTHPTHIAIHGSLFGDEARGEFLEKLRGKFREGKAVTFVADIVTATSVQYVIVDSLRFAESGGRPDQLDYALMLRESPPPPPPPDPLGGLDAGLLDQAGSFLDSVTGALDLINGLGSIPDFGDPTAPIQGVLDGVKSATAGLGSITDALKSLYGV
jgi:hypothetical protein